MSDPDPPLEALRFGRDQTPESPRPVHIPEPSTIPVLLNQMDEVFNDTETYNIPHDQTFSPYSDTGRVMTTIDPNAGEDAVQNFLRGAEEINARLDENNAQLAATNHLTQDDATRNADAEALTSVANGSALLQDSDAQMTSSDEQVDETQNDAHGAQSNKIIVPIHEADSAPDHLNAAIQSPGEASSRPTPTVKPDGGIDYQSLLDTISQSASTAPVAESVSAPNTTADSVAIQGPPPILSVPGLPPKPPVQAQVEESLNVYAFPSANLSQQSQYQPVKQEYPNTNENGMSAYPSQYPVQPAPLQPPGTGAWPQVGSQASTNQVISPIRLPLPPEIEPIRSTDPTERPWTPSTQALYDSFLEDERRYVIDGVWDKFPMGSRLFVGNLPSEKVTKRDIFHIFHKHGRLAQISIKQAYGFVQYLEAASCAAALHAEQGVEVRGRKVHLEVSKPQKNTRNFQPKQGEKRRRSRSPDRRNSQQNDRFDRSNHSDFRDERGRRAEYRRSPSPSRSYRSRDDYRMVPVQSPRYGPGGRPESPYAPSFPSYPPQPPAHDDETALQLPRRDPRDVPDVQLLILDQAVAQSFINWIEQGFRNKGLRASTIWLSVRLPLAAVVKRQIIEGVQAVVKLVQSNQYNSKVPLQVFDRSQGTTNVSFNEYVDLDIAVAADIVSHARQKERGGMQQSPQSYQPVQSYPPHPPQGQYPAYPPQPPAPHYPPAPYLPPHQQHQQHNQYQYNQNQQYQHHPPPVTPTSATAAPNLQQLLANLRQPGDSAPNSASPTGRPGPDFAGLLNNSGRQQMPPHQQPQHGYGPPAPAYGNGQQSQQSVQNIMDTLARYNR